MEVMNVLGGGFAEPVLGAQVAFRAVMGAMAEPGTIRDLPGDGPTPPTPLSPAMAAVICTLCDADTPLWLDPILVKSDAVSRWIAFWTGAPVTQNPVEAYFAVVSDPQAMPALESFALGSQEFPDRSTTIILQVADFHSGPGLSLSGPGIRVRASIAPAPMPRSFVTQWAANNAHYPRGIDMILAGPGAVAALPRTAKIANLED
ncbi:MAG: phosphonate C-P lyase system protein PhnH [Notoacmeibacter sp.]|nr:phosphonate C-P lyase system protein PhnH [Notoacmeibacter sp.]